MPRGGRVAWAGCHGQGVMGHASQKMWVWVGEWQLCNAVLKFWWTHHGSLARHGAPVGRHAQRKGCRAIQSEADHGPKPATSPGPPRSTHAQFHSDAIHRDCEHNHFGYVLQVLKHPIAAWWSLMLVWVSWCRFGSSTSLFFSMSSAHI